MRFAEAIMKMQNGNAVKRSLWGHIRLLLQADDKGITSTHTYIYHVGKQIIFIQDIELGLKIPWAPSNSELLADDWMVAEDS